MARVKFEIILEIDEEAQADHDGRETAPPDDPEDWNVQDIAEAIKKGIVKPYDSEVVEVEVLKE